MTTHKKHEKHAKLSKPRHGVFGPIAISLLGAPCSLIETTASKIMKALPDLKSAYIDARHDSIAKDEKAMSAPSNTTYITQGGNIHEVALDGDLDPLRKRALLHDRDIVLVNGNHFDAEYQILILDERKPLRRKMEKIRNPLMLLKQEDNQPIPIIPGKQDLLSALPVHKIDAIRDIAEDIRQIISANIPELYGLVLAGGMSTRMGTDKGALQYHGKPQRQHMFELLQEHTARTFLSCRTDQADLFSSAFPVLIDTFTGLGPYGALLSAIRAYPDKAWLVSACDLPLIGSDQLHHLVQKRDPYRVATAFHNEATNFPEPLIAIWEPRAYQVLLHFLSQGISCPRKVLINSKIKAIVPDDPDTLINVNSPEDHEAILKQIKENKV